MQKCPRGRRLEWRLMLRQPSFTMAARRPPLIPRPSNHHPGFNQSHSQSDSSVGRRGMAVFFNRGDGSSGQRSVPPFGAPDLFRYWGAAHSGPSIECAAAEAALSSETPTGRRVSTLPKPDREDLESPEEGAICNRKNAGPLPSCCCFFFTPKNRRTPQPPLHPTNSLHVSKAVRSIERPSLPTPTTCGWSATAAYAHHRHHKHVLALFT
jgi:hypothetical protein